MPTTTEAAEAYEWLRPHLLELSYQNGSNPEGLILLRRGMFCWVRERNQLMPSASVPVSNPLPPPVCAPNSGEPTTELVRLMATLILSHPKELHYAGSESHQLPSGA